MGGGLFSGGRLMGTVGTVTWCAANSSLLRLLFGLGFFGAFRQWLDERRIRVELRAGASPSALLVVLAAGSLDALQLSYA